MYDDLRERLEKWLCDENDFIERLPRTPRLIDEGTQVAVILLSDICDLLNGK